MTRNDWKRRTRAATVHLSGRGGQGVLVPGGFILTAAHCVEWYTTGGMALGDYCLATVKPKKGAPFRASIYAVEPVADIAVLGQPDDQELPDDAEAFDAFCDATQPVPVCVDDFGFSHPVRVFVLTHHDKWIAATATLYGMPGMPPRARICIEAQANIEGGTSGGPVVDEAGRLIGVVSTAGGSEGRTRSGMMPRPHLALPAWLWGQIEAGEARSKKTKTGAKR